MAYKHGASWRRPKTKGNSDAITGFSVIPVRIASGLGMLFGVAGMVGLLYALGSWPSTRAIKSAADISIGDAAVAVSRCRHRGEPDQGRDLRGHRQDQAEQMAPKELGWQRRTLYFRTGSSERYVAVARRLGGYNAVSSGEVQCTGIELYAIAELLPGSSHVYDDPLPPRNAASGVYIAQQGTQGRTDALPQSRWRRSSWWAGVTVGCRRPSPPGK